MLSNDDADWTKPPAEKLADLHAWAEGKEKWLGIIQAAARIAPYIRDSVHVRLRVIVDGHRFVLLIPPGKRALKRMVTAMPSGERMTHEDALTRALLRDGVELQVFHDRVRPTHVMCVDCGVVSVNRNTYRGKPSSRCDACSDKERAKSRKLAYDKWRSKPGNKSVRIEQQRRLRERPGYKEQLAKNRRNRYKNDKEYSDRIRSAQKSRFEKEENKKKRAEYSANYRASSPGYSDRHREHNRLYRARNRDKVREWDRRSKDAKKRGRKS